MCIYLNITLLY